MTGNHLLIAIEGVDGVGKTTVAKAIAPELDAAYVKTPAGNFLKKLAFLVEKVGSRELEAIIYLVLAFVSSLYFRVLLRKRNVVCDKYILVTIVDQIALGSRVARFFKGLRYVIARKPDFTFCLWVSDEAVLACRLQQKERIDHNDIQVVPLWREIQREYQEFPEVEIVDTTRISADDTVAALLSHIRNRGESI